MGTGNSMISFVGFAESRAITRPEPAPLLKAAEEKLELRGGGRVKVTVGKNGNKYYFKGGRRTAAPSRKKSTRTAAPSRKKSTRTKVTIGRDGKKYYFKGGKRVAAPKRVRK